MLTSNALAYFEGTIQKVIALALFIPLIISSGGNSGSQAASIVIRALAPFVATLVDVSGIVIYFTVARVLLL